MAKRQSSANAFRSASVTSRSIFSFCRSVSAALSDLFRRSMNTLSFPPKLTLKPSDSAILVTLQKLIEVHQSVLIVLDCLYWSHDKKENDSFEMKELMRQLVEIRDAYKVAVLVVHHTKKGVRYETMHNDNMRGSSVFAGATDTVLMFRRSSTDESKRLLKPTKLRHGDDKMRAARLLELNPSTLWFNDLGEADESAHIA